VKEFKIIFIDFRIVGDLTNEFENSRIYEFKIKMTFKKFLISILTEKIFFEIFISFFQDIVGIFS
jgi:hypothetical protein